MRSTSGLGSFFRRQRPTLFFGCASRSVSFSALFHSAFALLLLAGTISANAVTITFREAPQEGPVTALLDLTGCADCIKVAETGGTERGVVSFTAPAGSFNLPMGVTQAQANLVDLPATPGGTSTLSDWVVLEINNTPQLISITANFFSDSDNVITFPEFGPVPENGQLQDISGAFATRDAGGGFPAFPLPPNLIVKVQSDTDIIPEPSIVLLLSGGVLGFVVIGLKRSCF